MTTRIGTWIATIVGAAAVAVLASCGGGGGTDNPPPPTQTIYTTGPISGFGSVYVNGVRYDTSAADIEIDGAKVGLSDLRVGQVIDLKGHVQGGSSSADSISYKHNLEGPIFSVDAGALRFVAMGQTVLVGSGTSFGDGISPASIDGLKVGDDVEVSGLINAEGQIEATRIDLWSGSGPYDVFGTATGVDTAAKTFHITGLLVDYSAANVEDFPTGSPAEGDLVLATGFEFGGDGEFLATRIELRYDQQMMPAAGDKVHVEGFITRFVSATDFDVAGTAVTTTSSTVYENGTVGGLALDVHVCVEGTLDANGVLVAERVRFRLENEIRIMSMITAMNTAQHTLTALGLTVTTDVMTRFEDETTTGNDRLDLADFHTGEWVDIRGYEKPAGSGQVMATRVERIAVQNEHRMRGPFRNPAGQEFDILTVAIMTTTGADGTRFILEDDKGGIRIDAATFFAQPEGTLVEARGTWDVGTSVLTATRAIIKTCDD
jgi:hypothetical protein